MINKINLFQTALLSQRRDFEYLWQGSMVGNFTICSSVFFSNHIMLHSPHRRFPTPSSAFISVLTTPSVNVKSLRPCSHCLHTRRQAFKYNVKRPRASLSNNSNGNNNDNDNISSKSNSAETSPESEALVAEITRQINEFEGSAEEKRNQTIKILNDISQLPLDVSITDIYNRLFEDGRMKGFGRSRYFSDEINKNVINNFSPSLQQKANIASELSKLTGLPLSALTPRKSSTLNGLFQLVLISVIWLILYLLREYKTELYFINDTVKVLIYFIGIMISADQFIFNGVLFETLIYNNFLRTEKETALQNLRIVTHEAGHLFLAYMYGLPIQQYTLNSMDTLWNRIPGQAATLFADDELAGQLEKGKLKIHVVDRYAIVAMAGIAAEGLTFGEAVGGDSDVNGLISLLTGLKPAWEEREIRILARWAVVQAVQLIKKERAAYEAVKEAMQSGLGLGECIMKIEENLTESTSDQSAAIGDTNGVDPDKLELELQEKERRVKLQLEDVEQQVNQLDEQQK